MKSVSYFSKIFPTPAFIMPKITGIDFSDTTLRFLSLKEEGAALLPDTYKEIPLASGMVVGGRVKDTASFGALLTETAQKNNLHFVKISIPESQLYLCTLAIDSSNKKNIRAAIELVLEDHIPLTLNESVFDYAVLEEKPDKLIVQVVAAPALVIDELYGVCTDAGLIVLGFELEGQAAARAICAAPCTGTHMIVDFGATRTTITIVTSGISVFTSTLEFGGAQLTSMIAKTLNISESEAESLKRTYGITGGDRKDIFEIISGGVSTLKDEIHRRYIYWHQQNEQQFNFPRISDVYICGGYSNLPGLADYLSASLTLSVSQASPWVNCFSLEKQIPPIPKETAVSYIVSIGLCLSDYE